MIDSPPSALAGLFADSANRKAEATMATLSAIAHNAFEVIGLVRPRIEVIVREPADYTEQKPIRMQWVRETDAKGRKVMRIRWVEDIDRQS